MMCGHSKNESFRPSNPLKIHDLHFKTESILAVRSSQLGTFPPKIDCHSRFAWARLYTGKLPVTAVHLMNNDVLPTFEAHDAKIETVLSDNGREFCGRPDQHPYELFL